MHIMAPLGSTGFKAFFECKKDVLSFTGRYHMETHGIYHMVSEHNYMGLEHAMLI